MTTILFDRISWMFSSLTETLTKLKFSGLVEKVYADYKTFIENRERRRICSNINYLPDDCLATIFSKLEQKELLHCAVVCKKWKYVLDYHSELYHSVKLSLKSQHDQYAYSRHSCINDTERVLQQQYCNRGLVKFLVNKRASIRRLIIDWCFIDQFGFDTLGYLISSGCCKKLMKLHLNWTEDWSFGESAEFDGSYEFFLSLLVLLKKHCDSHLKSISTQFNWTADSVKYIGEFTKLKQLEVHCVPRVHCVQKWHIDRLMKSLIRLEKFKLVVTILPKLVQKYSLRSESLVTLDISDCVNLLITDMDLPKLKHLAAYNVQCHRMGVNLHKFCLFEVLHKGCPALQDINGVIVDRCDYDYGLSEEQHHRNKICFCPKHNFRIHKTF